MTIAKVLTDRVAVVIGAGSSGPGWGNGKACAVSFARAGASVVAVDMDLAAANETVAVIREEKGTAESFQANVECSLDIRGAMDRAIERFGRIDILHYNVGIVALGGCVELPEEQWERVLRINLTGCFLACKYVLPVMEEQGGGVLLTTGSIAALRWTGVNYVSYYATKGALVQLTRAVAMQYARRGIRAVSILPGLMNTPMIYGSRLENVYGDGVFEKMIATRNAQCPTGRMGDAWDVANAAVFLASDAAKYVTATEFVVDGGLVAGIK